ncbi:MAG: 4-phosphoerythronate dehydrogenase [Paludibacteraceae bacterium]|nr:4-phosphoerythronate dehydrogenase [Paludibacteraceae bacterium]
MRIVFDQYIPFLAEAVQSHWPQVQIYPMKPEEINASAVCEADVLVVRTRTRVDEQLLSGSRVRLVCTATIGYDHIDTAWCQSHGIQWMSCPGCNAQAVCDYIEEALSEATDLSVCPSSGSPTIGVVGVGHVGSKVAAMVERKGMRVLLNDPPKHIGVSLHDIAGNCDIITFHVPLDATTHHLCNADFLRSCRPGALIINAARGGVVDEQALLESGHPYILDTWENEPHLNHDVLQHALLASMHIAGYSMEGKRNATQMCLDAVAAYFHLPPVTRISGTSGQSAQGDTAPGWLARISAQLKEQPGQFELLRKNYILR